GPEPEAVPGRRQALLAHLLAVARAELAQVVVEALVGAAGPVLPVELHAEARGVAAGLQPLLLVFGAEKEMDRRDALVVGGGAQAVQQGPRDRGAVGARMEQEPVAGRGREGDRRHQLGVIPDAGAA